MAVPADRRPYRDACGEWHATTPLSRYTTPGRAGIAVAGHGDQLLRDDPLRRSNCQPPRGHATARRLVTKFRLQLVDAASISTMAPAATYGT